MIRLRDHAKSHKTFSFQSLFEGEWSKMEVIVTFLAVLELIKAGALVIVQEGVCEEIQITSKIAA